MNELPGTKIIARQSLQSEVLALLREEIVDGVWKPGERLQERVLSERFGISRSPLREAYHVLAAEGLLELSPNRGAVVSAPTLEQVLQHHVVLQALEILAMTLACEYATDEQLAEIAALHKKMHASHAAHDMAAYFQLNNKVHQAIVLASGNQPLIDATRIFSRQIIRVQQLNGALLHPSDDSMGEHDSMITALLARNKRKATAEMKKHLKTVERNMRSRLREALSD